MELLIATALALLGAIVASFVGVIVARLNTGQSFVHGHSKCDACNITLTPLSLVPVLSFVVMRGRAQCCGARISPWSPFSELLLGALFVLAYYSLGLTLTLVGMCTSLSLLLALVLYDLQHQILPSVLLYPFVVTSAATASVSAANVVDFSETTLVAFVLGMILAAIHFFSRGRAMGLADAPLAFGLALLVGSSAIAGFIFSFWVGAVVGIGLLASRPRGSRMGVEVPFAPFLACGFLLAYFTQWNPFTLINVLIH